MGSEMKLDEVYKAVIAAFWAIMLIMIGSGVNKMDKISDSVNDLNKNVAVIIQQRNEDVKKIDDHEGRLRTLEKIPKP